MTPATYVTAGGIRVTRSVRELPPDSAMAGLLARLDAEAGAVFSSGYEYPGRYNRWEMGFVNPPLELRSLGRDFTFSARNDRGRVLLGFLARLLEREPHLEGLAAAGDGLSGRLRPMPEFFPEEERSRQPSLFSVLRAVVRGLGGPQDANLGFYGAFGYDLVFQFEPVTLRHARPAGAYLDAFLYFPDEVVLMDRRMEKAFACAYDFERDGVSTAGRSVTSAPRPSVHARAGTAGGDHAGRRYDEKVELVREGCRRGDHFEVVLSQVFALPFAGKALDVFARVRTRNPSPYEFVINMDGEQLVGASPEMFVRVEGRRLETCPISGTVARGESPMEDADRIEELLSSRKEEAELTMCTDVDRNDKSRVCDPASVTVLGRRLIEVYSKVIHTVDHVEGTLLPGRDGLDAFLSHMWACTLTGSPKPAAMQVIEDLEESPRGWYGGAVGAIKMNGDVNTGITIRTVHLKDGVARVRVGATLLYASDPEAERRETEMKAEAFLRAASGAAAAEPKAAPAAPRREGEGRRVLFVDHQDSFVHTLAGYVRRTGAEVLTLRAGFPHRMLEEFRPDLVFLSPGPFTPRHFGLPDFILEMMARRLPMFGVCLGLQGMVEALGGELGVLGVPQHGVRARITHGGTGVFEGLPSPMTASRYHSLFAVEAKLPSCLEIQARSDDGVIMALRHRDYPMAAVQFHPESIHALRGGVGMELIQNAVRQLR